MLFGAFIVAGLLSAQGKLPERDQIDPAYRWDLGDIYPTVAAWEKDFNFVDSHLDDLASYAGKLNRSGMALLKCLTRRDEVLRILDKLNVYASLKNDEDTRINENQALADRVAGLTVRFEEATAYIIPEIQQIPELTLERFIHKTPGLKDYDHSLRNLIRQRAHTLDAAGEKLLAMSGELANSPEKIYTALTTTDLEFPSFVNDAGEEVQLSEGRYYKALQSADRAVRRSAFEGMFKTYEKIVNTNAAAFSSAVKADIFYARARNYNSTLEAALDDARIPVEVYHNLIQTVGANLAPLQRYLKLRRKITGIDDPHLYDASYPLSQKAALDYPYDEAVLIVEKAFTPLGGEYTQKVSKALSSRWIDVYETAGKGTGGYSWGPYDVHPYILLNYSGTLDDLFTLAHEVGHALHSVYTNSSQPYSKSEYTLFTAEVASTFNENLLLRYLLKTVDSRPLKIALIDQWIGNLISTVYVQTMFAEFELNVHTLAENGEALTAETLNQAYLSVLQKYFGAELVIDDLYKLNWGRIPHFYEAFYVYKYATSFCASAVLAQRVFENQPGATEAYLNFLKAGNSDYSLELLKSAGVDMSSPRPIIETIVEFDKLVDQLENLLTDR